MAFPFSWTGPKWKPKRGTRVLNKEVEDAEYELHARKVRAIVRKRDGKCRWPEKHTCRFDLECAHVLDASLGGPMEPWNLILVCAWIHRRGPESIHGKQLCIERETPIDAETVLFSFHRQRDDGSYYLIARELAPFIVEHD